MDLVHGEIPQETKFVNHLYKNDKLHAAIQFMKDDLHNNNLSLDDVAAHVGVSKHHLCRLFQKTSIFHPLNI